MFIKSEHRKTSECEIVKHPPKLLLNTLDEVGLKKAINMLFYQISKISYTLKKYQKVIKNSNFKISAPTLNQKLELPDRSYYVSDIQNHFEYIIKNMKERLAFLQ